MGEQIHPQNECLGPLGYKLAICGVGSTWAQYPAGRRIKARRQTSNWQWQANISRNVNQDCAIGLAWGGSTGGSSSSVTGSSVVYITPVLTLNNCSLQVHLSPGHDWHNMQGVIFKTQPNFRTIVRHFLWAMYVNKLVSLDYSLHYLSAALYCCSNTMQLILSFKGW